MSEIKISAKLRNKLPEPQKKGLEEALWYHASERCFLMNNPLTGL